MSGPGDRSTRGVRARRAAALARAREKPGATRIAVAVHVIAAVVPAAFFVAGCTSAPDSEPAAGWRADCAKPVRPAPLSLEAAREAHRLAERRHLLRLREARAPGSFLREVHAALDPERVAGGEICPDELANLGELVFEHEYGFADGLGGGQAVATNPAGPFRRVHEGAFGGPETISCSSCHWIGGPNGAGAETDNAFLHGNGDRIRSGDDRNPPALIALGVVEALAREMTRELHRQRDAIVAEASRAGEPGEARLIAKGVDFGVLRAAKDGEIDVSGVRGVDGDLVVKPFGWKGTLAAIEAFSGEALQMHIGVQSDSLIATASADMLGRGSDPDDPDDDGVRGELGRGPLAAMTVHLALLELPIAEPLAQHRPFGPAAEGLLAPTTTSFADDFRRGRKLFHEIGCASCHVPMMVLDSPVLALEGLPSIDLSQQMREPALTYDASVGGYPVWLYSDLKRHDMGKSNAARHVQSGVARREYLTPRLWGVADSAPYLHDGRAPSFDYAIAGHDGEGAGARAAFAGLDRDAKGALRVYLMSLRRASRVVVP